MAWINTVVSFVIEFMGISKELMPLFTVKDFCLWWFISTSNFCGPPKCNTVNNNGCWLFDLFFKRKGSASTSSFS